MTRGVSVDLGLALVPAERLRQVQLSTPPTLRPLGFFFSCWQIQAVGVEEYVFPERPDFVHHRRELLINKQLLEALARNLHDRIPQAAVSVWR